MTCKIHKSFSVIALLIIGQLKKDKSGEASCSLCCVLLWCQRLVLTNQNYCYITCVIFVIQWDVRSQSFNHDWITSLHQSKGPLQWASEVQLNLLSVWPPKPCLEMCLCLTFSVHFWLFFFMNGKIEHIPSTVPGVRNPLSLLQNAYSTGYLKV